MIQYIIKWKIALLQCPKINLKIMAAMNLRFNYKFIYGNVNQQHQNILMHK